MPFIHCMYDCFLYIAVWFYYSTAVNKPPEDFLRTSFQTAVLMVHVYWASGWSLTMTNTHTHESIQADSDSLQQLYAAPATAQVDLSLPPRRPDTVSPACFITCWIMPRFRSPGTMATPMATTPQVRLHHTTNNNNNNNVNNNRSHKFTIMRFLPLFTSADLTVNHWQPGPISRHLHSLMHAAASAGKFTYLNPSHCTVTLIHLVVLSRDCSLAVIKLCCPNLPFLVS